MPQYPVLQPDGKLAVWSTVVDHFIALDCTREEAVSVLDRRYSDHQRSVELVAKVAAGERPFERWDDWPDCVAWVVGRDGEEDADAKELLARTPDPMTRRYIEMRAALGKTEVRADEAQYGLNRAREALAAVPRAAIRAVWEAAKALNSERGLGMTPDLIAVETWLAREAEAQAVEEMEERQP